MPGINSRQLGVVSLLFVTSVLVVSSFLVSLPVSFAIFSRPHVSFATCSPPSCQSTNWSGYALSSSSNSVSDANASWIVPTLTCPSKGTTYVALWVGIDGLNDNTVEQTGVLDKCSNGAASYSAWYEFYPNPSVAISSITVRPGDAVSAGVSYSSTSNEFTTTITDGSQSFSTSATVSGAQRSSAEWIVERPETCIAFSCKLTTLANFGTAYFGQDYTPVTGTNYATVNGVSGQISAFAGQVVEITMVSGGRHSTTLAQPSALSIDGTSFTVLYG